MDHYTDIKLLSDAGLLPTVLMNHLFAKLHIQLGQTGEGRIGVSFPEHGKTLGKVLRLHGKRKDLEKLMSGKWYAGLLDYVQFGEISLVPETIQGYRVVRRVQKKSPANMYKRSLAKGWITQEEADQKVAHKKKELLTLPFVQIESLSTRHMMCVFIKHDLLQQKMVVGDFSAYGLSSNATIPWF